MTRKQAVSQMHDIYRFAFTLHSVNELFTFLGLVSCRKAVSVFHVLPIGARTLLSNWCTLVNGNGSWLTYRWNKGGMYIQTGVYNR